MCANKQLRETHALGFTFGFSSANCVSCPHVSNFKSLRLQLVFLHGRASPFLGGSASTSTSSLHYRKDTMKSSQAGHRLIHLVQIGRLRLEGRRDLARDYNTEHLAWNNKPCNMSSSTSSSSASLGPSSGSKIRVQRTQSLSQSWTSQPGTISQHNTAPDLRKKETRLPAEAHHHGTRS